MVRLISVAWLSRRVGIQLMFEPWRSTQVAQGAPLLRE